MLTVRATTGRATMSEMASSAMSVVQALMADTSVGLKAVAVANEKGSNPRKRGEQSRPTYSSFFISGNTRGR
jgi:hypothetical protein